MSSDTLPHELLAYCQIKWNQNMQSFQQNIPNDTISCCTDSCQEMIDVCHQRCQEMNTSRCKQKCNDLVTNCMNACLELPSQDLGTLRSCTEEIGCGRFPVVSQECMLRQKNAIIKCCENNPDNIHCRQGYTDMIVRLGKNIKTTKYTTKRILSRKISVYFYILSCVIAACIALYILKMKK